MADHAAETAAGRDRSEVRAGRVGREGTDWEQRHEPLLAEEVGLADLGRERLVRGVVDRAGSSDADLDRAGVHAVPDGDLEEAESRAAIVEPGVLPGGRGEAISFPGLTGESLRRAPKAAA